MTAGALFSFAQAQAQSIVQQSRNSFKDSKGTVVAFDGVAFVDNKVKEAIKDAWNAEQLKKKPRDYNTVRAEVISKEEQSVYGGYANSVEKVQVSSGKYERFAAFDKAQTSAEVLAVIRDKVSDDGVAHFIEIMNHQALQIDNIKATYNLSNFKINTTLLNDIKALTDEASLLAFFGKHGIQIYDVAKHSIVENSGYEDEKPHLAQKVNAKQERVFLIPTPLFTATDELGNEVVCFSGAKPDCFNPLIIAADKGMPQKKDSVVTKADCYDKTKGGCPAVVSVKIVALDKKTGCAVPITNELQVLTDVSQTVNGKKEITSPSLTLGSDTTNVDELETRIGDNVTYQIAFPEGIPGYEFEIHNPSQTTLVDDSLERMTFVVCLTKEKIEKPRLYVGLDGVIAPGKQDITTTTQEDFTIGVSADFTGTNGGQVNFHANLRPDLQCYIQDPGTGEWVPVGGSDEISINVDENTPINYRIVRDNGEEFEGALGRGNTEDEYTLSDQLEKVIKDVPFIYTSVMGQIGSVGKKAKVGLRFGVGTVSDEVSGSRSGPALGVEGGVFLSPSVMLEAMMDVTYLPHTSGIVLSGRGGLSKYFNKNIFAGLEIGFAKKNEAGAKTIMPALGVKFGVVLDNKESQ